LDSIWSRPRYAHRKSDVQLTATQPSACPALQHRCVHETVLSRYGVTSAASDTSGVLSPGQLFYIAGSNFSPSTLNTTTFGSDGRASTNIAGTQVLFDGTAAPLNYAVNTGTSSAVTGWVPSTVGGKSVTQIKIVSKGISSLPASIPLLDAVPHFSPLMAVAAARLPP
jgi:uncharacterized protein (TIGR03437 family)